MLNVHDLERRWLKYRIKRLIPFILISSVLLISFISAIVYYPFNSTQDTKKQKAVVTSKPLEKVAQQKEPLNSTVKDENDTVQIDVPQNTQYQHEKKTLVLKPSLHFMDNIEDGIDPYISETSEEPLHNGISEEAAHNQISQNSTYDTTDVNTNTPVNQQIQNEPKKKLTIITEEKESDLKDVIRRFKKNKNPALSLFIAKRYYEHKKYQKSYNYALMTNEIDKNIDESWIIFAKSLVKLGQHELAMVTLKSYLKTTKSSKADILLRKIEAGTFR